MQIAICDDSMQFRDEILSNLSYCVAISGKNTYSQFSSAEDLLYAYNKHIKTSCELLESQNSFICGYSIIDTILSIKNERAISLGIKLDVEIELQQRIGVDTIDLSVIMGNAIDNAIEATEKLSSNHKAVDISIISKNYSLIIIIKNPVPHKIDISNLISTKADSESHGYGILQMRSLAKKYNGDIFFDCNDEQFKTTIILNYNE